MKCRLISICHLLKIFLSVPSFKFDLFPLLENGNVRINTTYLSPIHLARDRQPDGTENKGGRCTDRDMVDYDTISDYHHNDDGFTGVGAEREQSYMYDRAKDSLKGSSAGSATGPKEHVRSIEAAGNQNDDYISATNT